MFSRKLLLVLLIIFPIYLTNSIANAQIDIPDDDEDDSEAEVEDLRPDGAAVVGAGSDGFLSDDDDPVLLKPSPDADTVFLFTQPAGGSSLTELPAGKDVHFLVGFANKGTQNKDFVLESLDASFRYPLDFSFHIQNFSAVQYERVVKPKQDVSLYYAFYTSETYSSRPFGLVVNLLYRDSDGRRYLDAVFNETVTIVEVEDSLDGETFFLYVLLLACAVLVLVASQQFVVNFTRKKISMGSSKIETGTQGGHGNDVDYDWLPKGTLDDFNRSPSPRKQHQSPKQSPKQPTQRKVKRGAKDE